MEICASCKAEILWTTLGNGRKMPLDPARSDKGNLRVFFVNRVPVSALVLGGAALAEAVAAGETLHISHFATCPNAGKHRKKN